MLRLVPVLVLLALAGCASPAQECRTGSTRALVKLDGMIAEAEATLARGYRLIAVPGSSRDFLDCVVQDDEPTGLCLAQSQQPGYLRQEINVPAEEARLQALRLQRPDEARRAEAALALCPAG